jgi:predicted permease
MARFDTALPAGIRRLFRLPSSRDRIIREDDEEMRFHLEMWTAEFRAQGLNAEEAHAKAQQRFGDYGEYKRHSRQRAERLDRWHSIVDWLVEWRQDIRFALRHFRKAPAFALVAVFTLALGIGANTAIFSIVHHLLISPLPYPNGERTVRLVTFGKSTFIGALASLPQNGPMNPPDELRDAWIKRSKSFEQIGGIAQDFLFLLPDKRQDTVSYAAMTANFLDLLGVRPSLGRGFRPDEEGEGPAHNVAMLSHRWWMSAYGGRSDVIGQTLQFEGAKYTIVGVMPETFTIPMEAKALDRMSNPSPDVWLPITLQNSYLTFGLLRRGVSVDAATAELQHIANGSDWRANLRAFRDDSVRARAMRAQDFLAPREVRTIEVLFAAVGALLLIACANVANLLLVRAWTRRREFAVRMGLGAGRTRLVRLALTESTLLALAAGALGILIAWQALHWIVALRPISLDALAGATLDSTVLAWTAAISVVTGILFGGAAAFFVSSRSVGDLLRNDARSSSDGVSVRIRSGLIIAEIALSVVLLVGAGLLTRSFAQLQDTPLGLDPHNLVSLDVLLPRDINGSPNAPAVKAAIAERLAHVPGATSAAMGFLPTAGFSVRPGLETDSDGGIKPVGGDRYLVTMIDANYFQTAGIKLVAGRLPRATPADIPPVVAPPQVRILRSLSDEVVVSQTLARRIAPNGDVLGRHVRSQPGRSGPGIKQSDAWSTIVGIVEDVRLPGAWDEARANQIYSMPFSLLSPTYVVRFTSVPANLESTLRQAVQTVAPTIVGRRARVADNYVKEALAPTRFMLALLGAFAIVAIILATVGLYGSIAYSVGLRTREIGIRVALGATPRAVIGLVLSDGVRLIVVGVILGVISAAATTRALTTLLYGVDASDPMTFGSIALLVIGVATAASIVPARRATAIDPMEALRAD